MTHETGGHRHRNSPSDDPLEFGQRTPVGAPGDAAMDAVLAAIDELRAAQDALSVTTTPHPPGEYDRAVADLLREAQATADSIRLRAEQEALTIRRLARIDAERFFDELRHLRQRMAAVEAAFHRDFPPVRGGGAGAEAQVQAVAARAADVIGELNGLGGATLGAARSAAADRWELFDRLEAEEAATRDEETPDGLIEDGGTAGRGTRGWWTRVRGA